MKELPDNETLYTFEEAMAYLKISRSTLYTHMRNELIQGHKVGRMWRFYLRDLRSFVNRENAIEDAALIVEHS